jgi:hypothetical protein
MVEIYSDLKKHYCVTYSECEKKYLLTYFAPMWTYLSYSCFLFDYAFNNISLQI